MAQSQHTTHRLLTHRQDTARRHHPIPPQNHRPVVQRRLVEKDGGQQLLGNIPMDCHSRINHPLRQVRLLKHNQGPVFSFAQSLHGLDHLLNDKRLSFPVQGETSRPTDLRQSPPDFRLEENQKGQNENRNKSLQQKTQHPQLKKFRCSERHQKNQEKSAQHLGPLRPAQELVPIVKHGREEQDLQYALPTQVAVGLQPALGHDHRRSRPERPDAVDAEN